MGWKAAAGVARANRAMSDVRMETPLRRLMCPISGLVAGALTHLYTKVTLSRRLIDEV